MNRFDEFIILLRYKISILIVKVKEWLEENTGIR